MLVTHSNLSIKKINKQKIYIIIMVIKLNNYAVGFLLLFVCIYELLTDLTEISATEHIEGKDK